MSGGGPAFDCLESHRNYTATQSTVEDFVQDLRLAGSSDAKIVDIFDLPRLTMIRRPAPPVPACLGILSSIQVTTENRILVL